MSRGKRYKRVKKRFNNFLLFYVIIAVIIFTFYTLSRYTTTINKDDNLVDIAKFNVKVNDVIVNNEEPFQIRLSPNANTYNNKIAPDVKNGYFEITINPSGSEVSLEYEFIFNLEKIDENVQITKYTINDGQGLNIVNNVIAGDILLPDNGQRGFKDEDAIIIKVYWQWDEDIVNPVITDNNTISVTSTIKQKLNT